jgi:MFS family permease
VNWPKGTLEPLRQRNFALLFAARAVSSFGDRLTPIALAFAVLGSTGGSASALGVVLAAGAVPTVAFVLLGGVLGDRLPRRRLLVGSDLVRAAVQATVAELVISGAAAVWELAALNALYGTASAFFLPASQSLVADAVEPEGRQAANALLGLTRNGTAIAAPACAGALIAAADPGWAIGADAVTFVVGAACVAAMRLPELPPLAPASLLVDLRGGWDEFRSRTWVWTTVAQLAVFHLIALAPFFVLGPLVAADRLGGAPAWAAILAASGAGSVAGGVLSLRVSLARPLTAAWAALALAAPQFALLAVSRNVAPIAAAAFLGAAVLTGFNCLWATALQQHVPPHALSRVSSYDWLGSLLLLPVGYALAGPVAALTSPRAVLGAAAVYVAAAGAATAAVPSIRRVGGAAAVPSAPPRTA